MAKKPRRSSKNRYREKNEKLTYRTIPLSIREDGTPETLDEENRSVEVVGATETAVMVFDYERYEIVPEVLLMSGLVMPKSRQVVLLDSHQRYDTSSVIGSYRNMSVENSHLIGRTHFSSVPEAEGPYTKVREGHITDFSAGYRILKSEWIPNGEKRSVEGKSYEGPLRVTTKWTIRELSVVPIGADENAKIRAETNQEDSNMDKKLREFLVSRGMADDATEEAAWEFLGKLDDPEKLRKEFETKQDPLPDVEKIRQEAQGDERARIIEIDAMCERFDCKDLANGLIADGKTVDEAREKVLDHVDEANKKRADNKDLGYFGDIEIGLHEKDKFRDAAQDAILVRSGMIVEKPAPGHDELTGFSLVELARHSLRMGGHSVRGRALEMVGRALTTSDFPYLLANVANKSLFTGWETADETWKKWCATGSVNDFKTNYAPRVSEGSDLDEIPESVEYNYGKRTEAQESYAIATYGKLFALSRQTIINDDLNALTNIPQMHGESAARKVGDIAYAVLTANAAMGDAVALFHATHANLAVGGDVDPPGIATMAAGILAMKGQKDLQGLRRLNIRPIFFIAPIAIEGTTEIFFRSGNFADSDTVATDSSLAATRDNPYAGKYFTRIYEPRLDDDSATAWYFAAQKGKTVTVYFLDGVQAPYMETKNGWNVDGVEYKVRIDAGAKAMDWKGMYKNAGT